MRRPEPHPPDEPRPAAPGAFARARWRKSPVLRGCAVVAFLEYGALAAWAVFGRSRVEGSRAGVWFPVAGWLALCSLGSWFFLFLWYPFLETLQAKETGDGAATRTGRVLEGFAIACVAVIHGMVALTMVEGLRH